MIKKKMETGCGVFSFEIKQAGKVERESVVSFLKRREGQEENSRKIHHAYHNNLGICNCYSLLFERCGS